MDLDDIIEIANAFDIKGSVATVEPYGNGNINDTFVVMLEGDNRRYILQKVNTHVFSSPESVMDNMYNVTTHIDQHIQTHQWAWQIQKVIHTKTKEKYLLTEEGSFWRMISFIKNAKSMDTIDSPKRAYELGVALGLFHRMIIELPHDTVSTVLEGFHVSPKYLEAYSRTYEGIGSAFEGADENFAFQFIEQNRTKISVLEAAKAEGVLPLRVIHGDPKINNIMFDLESEKAVSVIDLDTIQPGLIHYDIGDCARSSCNRLGEDAAQQWREVAFDLEIFKDLWRGYREHATHFLSKEEYDYVYDAIFLIAFELGIRFFTDYLNGDIYFKIKYPKHNLYRALVQFRLAQSIQEQRMEIEQIVKEG